MEKLLCKHWSGWLNPESMKRNPDWLNFWADQAQKSLNNGNELVIIEIPKNSGALEAIERLLQAKYPLNAYQEPPQAPQKK